jgi:hypothetical protein
MHVEAGAIGLGLAAALMSVTHAELSRLPEQPAPGAPPEVGQLAPDFAAGGTDSARGVVFREGLFRLSEQRGKRHVLLAFYVADFTGG